MNRALLKYNGMQFARDWVGQRVKLVREITTGAVVIPVSAWGTIESISPSGLNFLGDACKCCGVRVRVKRLDYHDVVLLDSADLEEAAS